MRLSGQSTDLVPEGIVFLQAVIDALPAEVCVIDTDAQIVSVNASWSLFGQENGGGDYGVGENYIEGMRTSGEQADAEVACDAVEGVEGVLSGSLPSYRLEYPCHGPSEPRWFLMTATPLRLGDATGPPSGAVITHLDVTSRITTERKTQRLMADLLGQERRLDDLLRDVPASVWEATTDASAETIAWVYGSAHTRTMLGYPVADWLASPGFFYDRVLPEDRARVQREIAALIAGSRNGVLSFTWVARDGRRVRVESVTNITAEDNGVFRLRCVTTDVTRRLQVQETLRTRTKLLINTARDLRASNNELDQFAYVASHDLRAPLRGIRQLAEFLAEDLGDNTDQDVQSKLQLMQARVGRMEKLIAGLLQYGRIGRVVGAPVAIEVDDVISEVLEMLNPPPGVTIHRSMTCGSMIGDKMRLQQVLLNLISNAISHHDKLPDGPANVWVSCDDAGAHWAISVRDDGPGIDAQYHDKVFRMFQTLDEPGGNMSTGIGLSLVAKIASHLDTNVELESSGRGATFVFKWPKRSERLRQSLLKRK